MVGAITRVLAQLTVRRRNPFLHAEREQSAESNYIRTYIRKKMQKEDGTQGKFNNVQRKQKKSTLTAKIKHSAFWRPSERRSRQRNQRYMFDKSDTGEWIREEAVVDSGAVECVTSKKRMPHLRLEETSESRGENVDMRRRT